MKMRVMRFPIVVLLKGAFHFYSQHSTAHPPSLTIHQRKFEQILAQWETAQTMSDMPSKIVGRKNRQDHQEPLNSDAVYSGGSRFRRKLSHGLSFISNPLSQRKTTPIYHTPNRLSLGWNGIGVHREASAGLRESEALSPTTQDSASLDILSVLPTQHKPQLKNIATDLGAGRDQTPKPLPRSRTMSYIPRPTSGDSEPSILEVEPPLQSRPPAFTLSTKARTTPTKIPVPSPTPSQGLRRGSPRQYMHKFTTAQQEKYIAAGAAFAGANLSSPSRASRRSHTTPNLVKGLRQPPSGWMIPRKPTSKRRLSGSPNVRFSAKENTPTSRKDNNRVPQIQPKDTKRESLLPVPSTSNRRSFGPGNSLAQSKQRIHETPSAAAKRLGHHPSISTPSTVKRVSAISKVDPQSPNGVQYSTSSRITQPRLMGPINPPTPKLTEAIGIRPRLPRSNTEINLRRRTDGNGSSLPGTGLSLRKMKAGNGEVRVPRSSTFHHLGRHREPPPPVPPIPEKFRNQTQVKVPFDFGGEPGKIISSVPQSRHQYTESDLTTFDEANPDESIAKAASSFRMHLESIADASSSIDEPSDDEVVVTLPKAFLSSVSGLFRVPNFYSFTVDGVSYANEGYTAQVKDHMPPIWWAGRFQARFDQWRNDAMQAALDPKFKPEGILGQCKLSEEKAAACYVFAQLRDLCGSKQALDSLWVFEYKYRLEHNIATNCADLPPVAHKLDENSTPGRGPFGRAVRKLTPRKSSLVNLLKGKVWNHREDTKSNIFLNEKHVADGNAQNGASDSP